MINFFFKRKPPPPATSAVRVAILEEFIRIGKYRHRGVTPEELVRALLEGLATVAVAEGEGDPKQIDQLIDVMVTDLYDMAARCRASVLEGRQKEKHGHG